MGCDLHEEEQGGTTITNVGLVIDKATGCLRHKRERAWRLYRATKHMTGMRRLTGEAMRVWLDHAVHFCEISRLSLSALNACYKFVTAGLGTSLPLSNSVRRELRIFAGLIFLTEMDLASPTLDHMYCVDSGGAGFFA